LSKLTFKIKFRVRLDIPERRERMVSFDKFKELNKIIFHSPTTSTTCLFI